MSPDQQAEREPGRLAAMRSEVSLVTRALPGKKLKLPMPFAHTSLVCDRAAEQSIVSESAAEDAGAIWKALRAKGGYALACPPDDDRRTTVLLSLVTLAAADFPGRDVVWLCPSAVEARARLESAQSWGSASVREALRVGSLVSPRAQPPCRHEKPPCLMILENCHTISPARARHWLRTCEDACRDAPVLMASHAALRPSALHDWFFRRLGLQELWGGVRASRRLAVQQLIGLELWNRGCYARSDPRLLRPQLLKVRLRTHEQVCMDEARLLPLPARWAADLTAKVELLREQWSRDVSSGLSVLVTVSRGGACFRGLVAAILQNWGEDQVAQLYGKSWQAQVTAFVTGSKRFAVTTTASRQHRALHCRCPLRHYVLQLPQRAWQWWVVLSSHGVGASDAGCVEVVTTGCFEDKRALLLLNKDTAKHVALHAGGVPGPAGPMLQDAEFPAEFLPYVQLCLFARALAMRFPMAARQVREAPPYCAAPRRFNSPDSLCAYVSSRHLVEAGAAFAAGFLSLCWQAAKWLRPCVEPTYARPGQSADADGFCRRFGKTGAGVLGQLPSEVLTRCLLFLEGRRLDAIELLSEAGAAALLDSTSLCSFLARASRLRVHHQQQLHLAADDLRRIFASEMRLRAALQPDWTHGCQAVVEYVLSTRPTPNGMRAHVNVLEASTVRCSLGRAVPSTMTAVEVVVQSTLIRVERPRLFVDCHGHVCHVAEDRDGSEPSIGSSCAWVPVDGLTRFRQREREAMEDAELVAGNLSSVLMLQREELHRAWAESYRVVLTGHDAVTRLPFAGLLVQRIPGWPLSSRTRRPLGPSRH